MPIVHRFFPGGRPTKYLIAARVDETAEPAAPKRPGREFHGESLGDAAEIDFHPARCECDGARMVVDQQFPVVDQRPNAAQLGRCWEVGALVVKSPQPDERPDRHVERAVAGAAHDLTSLENGQHRLADVHRFARRGRVDRGQLAVAAVVAHQAIDFGDCGKGLVDRVSARLRSVAVRFDGDRCAHQVSVRTGGVRALRAGNGDRSGDGESGRGHQPGSSAAHGVRNGTRRPAVTIAASKPLFARYRSY